jgi:hypothetical protein
MPVGLHELHYHPDGAVAGRYKLVRHDDHTGNVGGAEFVGGVATEVAGRVARHLIAADGPNLQSAVRCDLPKSEPDVGTRRTAAPVATLPSPAPEVHGDPGGGPEDPSPPKRRRGRPRKVRD